MIKFDSSSFSLNKKKRKTNARKAFTLVEILFSMTVIGIIAAVVVPAFIGQANEKAWKIQRKGLFTRISQAIPTLPKIDGFGNVNNSEDTAAESFLVDGLSNALKVKAICTSTNLTSCDFPEKFTALNGETKINLSDITTLSDFNNNFKGKKTDPDSSNAISPYEQQDTKVAAFITANKESILVYYNPYCTLKSDYVGKNWTQPNLCVNFIYDLNGKKGPNTVGMDIGFISVLYPTESSIVAPSLYYLDIKDGKNYYNASRECKNADENTRIPNIDELASIFYNFKLIGLTAYDGNYHSSTPSSSNNFWVQNIKTGIKSVESVNNSSHVLCLKR